jgi:hypothetical protein
MKLFVQKNTIVTLVFNRIDNFFAENRSKPSKIAITALTQEQTLLTRYLLIPASLFLLDDHDDINNVTSAFATMDRSQGCQMVHFHTKNFNFYIHMYLCILKCLGV